MAAKILEVIWITDGNEFILYPDPFDEENGDYKLSCNGQAHIPVPKEALVGFLKDLISRLHD